MGIYNKIFHGVSTNHSSLARLQHDKDQRIALALGALRAHVMIADQNNVIVAMNASMTRMMHSVESDLRTELPDFSAGSLIGSSMDVFHRHPAHQKRVVSQLTEPYEAAVRVGGRDFLLVATPLFAASQRIGTVVEWRDDTQTNTLKQREQEQKRLEQAQKDKLSVITTALDSVSSNVMMADADGKIFFANKAVMQLLKNAEDDIRKELPAFNTAQLIGTSFDVFHRNPAHQRNLLGRLTGPYNANIQVGVRHFRLTAAPVFGQDRQRLATVVEWQDRTAELMMERDVETAIKAAIDGDLDRRIDNRAYDGFLGKVAGGINQLLESFDGVLNDAGGALHAMARGNLCQTIQRDYRGRYEVLKDDINATIARLFSVVRDIEAATSEVQQVSRELSTGNASLSQRTEEQAASLEETSAAMEELTRTVEQNTANASVARALASDAKVTAEEGGKVLAHAVDAMDAISTASHKIDEIIGVIDGIAFQTNLLALNAAVEAARAGDQGRGFAVVAGEVRNLAGMSSRAAKEIRELIRDSGTKVREGATLVGKSGETLARIIESVKKVNDIVEEIASSSNDQAKGLAEINNAVQEMDSTTQQNAAMVEEASGASEFLFRRAEALSSLMNFFDTGKQGS